MGGERDREVNKEDEEFNWFNDKTPLQKELRSENPGGGGWMQDQELKDLVPSDLLILSSSYVIGFSVAQSQ